MHLPIQRWEVQEGNRIMCGHTAVAANAAQSTKGAETCIASTSRSLAPMPNKTTNPIAAAPCPQSAVGR